MKKIVIIDDYKDFADMLREYIELRVNGEYRVFYDPEKALKCINNEKDIDIFITDYQMPKMTGFDLAKEVLEKFPKIKVIILSGDDQSTLKKIKENYNLDVELFSKSNTDDLIKSISVS